MKEIIQVRNLRKTYGEHIALKDISFQVERGRFVALLGPNGAGKSSLINILCTGTGVEAGTVIIDGMRLGRNDRAIRKRIGVVFQYSVLDELLTVEENLYTRGRLYRLRGEELRKRIEETAQMTGIADILKKPYGRLSGGQKRRCDIARAMIHLPGILLLDEPTTGLDAKIRSMLWELIGNIRKKTGMTLILTTHYLEEASSADRIIMLNRGEIIAQGTPAGLKERFAGDCLTLFTRNASSVKILLEQRGISYSQEGEGIKICLSSTLSALPLLELCRGKFWGFEVHQGSIESAYLSILESEGGKHG